MKSARLRRSVFILSVLAVSGVLVVGGLMLSASWITSGAEAPVPSDIIVVLAGEYTRALYAADLYNTGFASTVFISKPALDKSALLLQKLDIRLPAQEEVNKMILAKKGVPHEHIKFFGISSLSTAQEAGELKKIVDRTGIKSVLLVTSAYHARRAGIIFRDALKGCTVHVCATAYEQFPKLWWSSQSASRAVLLELSKLIYYKIGGSFKAE
jgi:uncharacterized SAM-binding protein YcdF (DUF218 family)